MSRFSLCDKQMPERVIFSVKQGYLRIEIESDSEENLKPQLMELFKRRDKVSSQFLLEWGDQGVNVPLREAKEILAGLLSEVERMCEYKKGETHGNSND